MRAYDADLISLSTAARSRGGIWRFDAQSGLTPADLPPCEVGHRGTVLVVLDGVDRVALDRAGGWHGSRQLASPPVASGRPGPGRPRPGRGVARSSPFRASGPRAPAAVADLSSAGVPA